MDNTQLTHYGVLGMKWGVRKKRSDASGTSGATNAKKAKPPKPEIKKKKKLSEMSDDDLRKAIARKEMEQRYKALSEPAPIKSASRGKEFVLRVLERSTENVLTQVTTRVLGETVNYGAKSLAKKTSNPTLKSILSDGAFINPKKGQKDK